MSRPTVADLDVRLTAIEVALASLRELLKPFAALTHSPAVVTDATSRTDARAEGNRVASRPAAATQPASATAPAGKTFEQLVATVCRVKNREELADARDDIRAARMSLLIDEQQQIDLVSECVLKSNKLAKGIVT
jgi:predicted lipid-binding transport protein (Tim44 family)